MQEGDSKEWRRRKTLIKPLPPSDRAAPHNIFQHSPPNPEHFPPQHLHHIVGDNAWKQSFYGQILGRSDSKSHKESPLPARQAKQASKQPVMQEDDAAMATQKSQLTRFCLDQTDRESRETRTLQRFAQTQKVWKKTEQSILARVQRNNSISYNAVKNLYLHPNPDKLALINDNVPQYWQHSLRDNQKQLKKHLRDNPFKQEVAEEMLQTLAGRRVLERSIPQIRPPRQNMGLKGRSIQERKEGWRSTRSKFFQQTYKAQLSWKQRWINEANCSQTISSLYTLH